MTKRKCFSYLVCIVALLFVLTGCSQYEDDEVAEQMAEIIEDVVDEGDSSFHYISRIKEYSDDGLILTDTYYDLDSLGNQTEWKKSEYKYDDSGNLLNITTTNRDNEVIYLETNHYDDNGLLIQKDRDDKDRDFWTDIYTYDESGNITERDIYDIDGNLSMYEAYIYENGLLKHYEYESYYTETVLTYAGNETTIEDKYYAYEEYDDEGRLRQELYDDDGTGPWFFTYEYIDDGNRETMITYDEGGELYYTETTTYDEYGREIQYEHRYYGGSGWSKVIEYGNNTKTIYEYRFDSDTNYESVLTNKSIYEYNDNELLLRSSTYDNNSVLSYSTEYEYSSNGDLISRTTTYEDGSIKKEVIPERWYNENGVLIKEVYYNDEQYIYEPNEY